MYHRTEEGFMIAFNYAIRMVKFHNRPYWLGVSKMQPHHYYVSVFPLKETDIEYGTNQQKIDGETVAEVERLAAERAAWEMKI